MKTVPKGESDQRDAVTYLRRLLAAQFEHSGFPKDHCSDAIKYIRNQALHGHSFIEGRETADWVLFYRVGDANDATKQHGFTNGYNALRRCTFIVAAILF